MKDRENNQPERSQLPPPWCGAICRNALNEVCIESCNVKGDCSAFEPKPNLKLEDMPRFPLNESGSMTREEKFTSVTIYLAKVVDHLQGKEDEQRSFTIYHSPQRVDPNVKKAILEVSSFIQSSENGNSKEKE